MDDVLIHIVKRQAKDMDIKKNYHVSNITLKHSQTIHKKIILRATTTQHDSTYFMTQEQSTGGKRGLRFFIESSDDFLKSGGPRELSGGSLKNWIAAGFTSNPDGHRGRPSHFIQRCIGLFLNDQNMFPSI